jgi:fumarate reductase flavoprotein subunit
MTLNQWQIDVGVIRRYCDLAAPTFEWLSDLGVEFTTDGLYRSGVSSTPRGHRPEGLGERVIEVLNGHMGNHDVDMAFGTRATGLVTEDRRVTGIRCGEDIVTCGAVVVATGGFGANANMIAAHYPNAKRAGDWTWYIGSDHAQGDGLTMMQDAGGTLAGQNRGLLIVTPGFSRDLERGLPGWVVMVNAEGRRFTDELASYSVMDGLIQKEGGKAYAILDEAAREAAKPTPTSQAYWLTDVLKDKADEGRIARADTLEDLADQIGADPTVLRGTIDTYNRDCARGSDTLFFKDPDQLRALTRGPYYAVEVRPAILCWTGTGVRIDPDAQVLSKGGTPIPGLYAAGETVGSVHGDRYIGGGGSFGPCIVFGKVAGTEAARFAKRSNDADRRA